VADPDVPIKHNREIIVHEISELPSNLWVFRVKSYSNTSVDHHPSIDLDNGLVECDCLGFLVTKAPQAEAFHHQITILSTGYHCKHIRHVVGILWRTGHISQICLRHCLWLEDTTNMWHE
jgi:hypothetical protein